MRKTPKNVLAGLPGFMHKSVVLACVGTTVTALACTGGLLYHHYTVIVPERERRELEAMKPGSEFDMQDTAKVLKA